MALPDGLAALFNMRPDRAADYLLEKGLQLTGPYWELDGPAHSRVFTVANLAKLDVLADIKDAVQEAIDTGETERWFRQRLEATLRKKGWWGPLVQVDPDTLEARIIQAGSRRRLQTIYRTNLQSAYMAGRHRQALEQADRAPWAQYLAVRDSRTRPAHAALHGKVFRLDSPEWSVISPPNGYNCRCRARYMSDRELAQRGLTPETDVRLLERTPQKVPTDPLTGETPARIIERGVSVPSRTKPGERDVLWADRGWDHLPGSDGAERALVDSIMATADKVGDIREVVLAELRRNGVEVAVPVVATAPVVPAPSAAPASPWVDHPEDVRAWHDAAFARAPSWLRQAVGDAERLTITVKRGTAHYDRAKNKIQMSTDLAESASARQVSTWTHEVGHHLDYTAGPRRFQARSSAYVDGVQDFVAARTADAKDLVDKSLLPTLKVSKAKAVAIERRQQMYKADVALAEGPPARNMTALRERYSALGLDLTQVQGALVKHTLIGERDLGGVAYRARLGWIATAIEERDAKALLNILEDGEPSGVGRRMSETHGKGCEGHLSDLFGSATNNKVVGSGGHSNSYLKGLGAKETECFANLCAMFAEGNPFWRVIVERFTPRMTKLFKEALNAD